jgi:hypothetical protein
VGATGTVTLSLPRLAFESFLGGRFTTLSGPYGLQAGDESTDLPIFATLAAPTAVLATPTSTTLAGGSPGTTTTTTTSPNGTTSTTTSTIPATTSTTTAH